MGTPSLADSTAAMAPEICGRGQRGRRRQGGAPGAGWRLLLLLLLLQQQQQPTPGMQQAQRLHRGRTALFFSPPMAPMLMSSPYAAGSSVPE